MFEDSLFFAHKVKVCFKRRGVLSTALALKNASLILSQPPLSINHLALDLPEFIGKSFFRHGGRYVLSERLVIRCEIMRMPNIHITKVAALISLG